jgi:uncharacterized protein
VSRIDTVLLKVASRCNINCDYCYVFNMGDKGTTKMPKLMSQETIEAVTASLKDLAQSQRAGFAVVLHGGEPLLLPKQRLKLLLTGLREALPAECTLSIQTNGILISDDVLDVCVRTRTSLAVSIDGPQAANDRHRLDFKGRSTFDSTVAGIHRLKAHPNAADLFSGILTVIDLAVAPDTVYSFFKELGVPSMDFLFRDGNHSRYPVGKASFESVEYGQWISRLWDIYMADKTPARVNILDDHTRLILGGHSSKEGKGTKIYGVVIIDTDGSVCKNDTLKSAFDGADRFERRWSVHRDRMADVVSSDEFREYSQLQHPTSDECRKCPELAVCGGGMPLYRWREGSEFNNPSVYCRDHLFFIDHIRRRLPLLISCKA